MSKTIFLDLDGTLIDVRHRLFNLFQELVPQSTFSFETYWEIKRSKLNQQQLLQQRFGYGAEQINEFKKKWLDLVEQDFRMDLDRPFEGVTSVLETLAKNNKLCLVTARQRPECVKQQIEKFGWSQYFSNLLVTGGKTTKEEIIRYNTVFSNKDFFVGDTGEDIHTANHLGIVSVAVCTGFLNKTALQSYNPRFVIDSILDIHETGLI